MAKADLHVHSRYSDHPSEWFLQRLGANESYTDPEFVYRTAKKLGMDFVTLTDHNDIRGALQLHAAHPEDTFISVESTTYFPEDGCKVHVLIYGISEKEFADIEELRSDIYRLSAYLHEKRIAHSVAHATYAVNDKLTVAHLEKLILLFDNFEAINGARARHSNVAWATVLQNLSPAHIEQLARTHNLSPASRTPWIKGLTGGTDDHAGLFIARTYTVAEARSVADFLAALRAGKVSAAGRHNDYHSLAFALYKIAYDFSRSRSSAVTSSLLAQITELIFGNGRLGLRNWLRLQKLRSLSRAGDDSMQAHLVALVDTLRTQPHLSIDARLSLVYDKVAAIADSFFVSFASSCARDLQQGNITNLVRNVASSIPGIFLAIPFFTTFRHMCEGRPLVHQLLDAFGILPTHGRKRVLWFTDTICEGNGIATMLRSIGWTAFQRGYELRIVTCHSPEEQIPELPPNVLPLPFIYEFTLPHPETFHVRVPSVLKAMRLIFDFDPDEVIVSTPGPVGLLGLLAGRLLNVPVTGIYHTDYSREAAVLTPDDSLTNVLETATRWFFSCMHEIRAPSHEYIHLLEQRGFERHRLRILPRGIDADVFQPHPQAAAHIRTKYGFADHFILCFAGRLTHDKNLAFLAHVYRLVAEQHQQVALFICGDGPYLPELQTLLSGCPNVVFTGHLPRHALAEIFSAAQLFVFPCVTDPYGLVVHEAQACGLPALVADQGGPQELVIHGQTGFVLPAHNPDAWAAQIDHVIKLYHNNRYVFDALGRAARARAVHACSWELVVDELLSRQSNVAHAATPPTSLTHSLPLPHAPSDHEPYALSIVS
ncbi:MAG: glycosyltransferase [bacterium]|nr:glycosyltransferase [bacterium]